MAFGFQDCWLPRYVREAPSGDLFNDLNPAVCLLGSQLIWGISRILVLPTRTEAGFWPVGKSTNPIFRLNLPCNNSGPADVGAMFLSRVTAHTVGPPPPPLTPP